MKKLVSIYITILAVVFVLGLLMDINGGYEHERVLWQIHNDFQKMVDHPQSTPDRAILNIIGRYEKFIFKYPKSPLAPKAQLAMGKIYVFRNDHPKAREIFKQIIENYSYNTEVVAQAQFAIGKSYEDEDDWPNAYTQYKAIIRDYPLTFIGFSVPFYIGQHYAARGPKKQADDAFGEAAEFYQNIAANHPGVPMEYAALRMLTACRLAQGKWTDAFYTAKRLMFQYPSAPTLFDTVKLIKDICEKNMNDSSCTVDTYTEFMHKNPGHPINPMLNKIINNINNPKHHNAAEHPIKEDEK